MFHLSSLQLTTTRCQHCGQCAAT